MPTITSIKPQRNGKRVNIYLDGKFGFGIDLENFVKLGLRVEQEFDDAKLAEIIDKAEFSKTLNNLLRFAMLRPRSKKEINLWLYRKKVPDSLHKKLFSRLKHLELLDDAKFTNWWIDQRMSFRPRSIRQLTYELRQKGIESSLIKKVIEKKKINELDICGELIQKNKYKWRRFEKEEKRRKVQAYLARKGFPWATIQKAINDMV